MRALYVNVQGQANRHRCAVYEMGYSYHAALSLSDHWQLEYSEAPDLPPLEDYDFVVFTHMDGRLEVSAQQVSQCKKSVGIFVEARKEPLKFNVFNYDVVAVADPTLVSIPPRLLALPRIAIRNDRPSKKSESGLIVCSFGLPSLEKEIKLMLDAVRELEQATLRLHFPLATFLPEWYQQLFYDELNREAEKSDINVELHVDFLDRNELIDWIAESDLVLFLTRESRSQITYGAIAASPDQAVASRTPMVVNDRPEYRHILEYIQPYPDRGLAEAMEDVASVEEMYKAWSPLQFCKAFEEFIDALE